MKGLIVFDKPKGITSHDLVYIVRKKLNIKKVGHTGTLDPMATGVLVICVGEATKVSEYILSSDKEYFAGIKLGILTDSYDMDGNILEKEDVKVFKDEILKVLEKFTGNLTQLPPKYSAIKVNGKKLYEYAREGKEVEVKSRNVEIYNNELVDFNGKDEFTINVDVSKGTYIRSLAYDIGKELNTNATLSSLRRTRTGEFRIEDAITVDEFKDMSIEEITSLMIPMDKALLDLKKISINKNYKKFMLNGRFYKLNKKYPDENYRVYCDGEFLGIGEIRIIDNEYFLKMKKNLTGGL